MSQLLQVATRSGLRVGENTLTFAPGTIAIRTGRSAPLLVTGGIPFDADGVVAVTNFGAIAYYHQGLPFTSEGRLCVELDGAVARVGNGGAPFTATGLLALSTSAVDRVIAGIPYTAEGQLFVSPSSGPTQEPIIQYDETSIVGDPVTSWEDSKGFGPPWTFNAGDPAKLVQTSVNGLPAIESLETGTYMRNLWAGQGLPCT